MEEVIRLLEEYAKMEPMHNNCKIKINRAEISPIQAFMKGKEEGARLLAIELLGGLNGNN